MVPAPNRDPRRSGRLKTLTDSPRTEVQGQIQGLNGPQGIIPGIGKSSPAPPGQTPAHIPSILTPKPGTERRPELKLLSNTNISPPTPSSAQISHTNSPTPRIPLAPYPSEPLNSNSNSSLSPKIPLSPPQVSPFNPLTTPEPLPIKPSPALNTSPLLIAPKVVPSLNDHGETKAQEQKYKAAVPDSKVPKRGFIRISEL